MPSKYVKQEPIKEDLVRNYLSGATEDDLKWLKIGLKEMKKREELLHPDEEQALYFIVCVPDELNVFDIIVSFMISEIFSNAIRQRSCTFFAKVYLS